MPKDIDEAQVADVIESALKAGTMKRGTRAKDIIEIRIVTMDSGEDKAAKYIEPQRKQTKGDVKEPPKSK